MTESRERPKLPKGMRWHRGKVQIRYRDLDGKQRTETKRNVTEARNRLRDVLSDLNHGTWTDPRLGQVPFEDFADDWLETTVHLKPSTRASYEMLLRRHVLPTFGPRRLVDIRRIDVQGWMSDLIAHGIGPGTVRNAYRVFSRILVEAKRSRMIPLNPAAAIPVPRSTRQEMRFLSAQEVDRLAEVIAPRYRALVLMASFSGLRWGELVALTPSRLDLLRGTVDVRDSLSEVAGRLETVPPKTGERRTVPLPRFLCDVLTDHFARYPGPYVFTAPAGGPLRRQNFYKRIWKQALRDAGLDEATRFHDLRHSAASIAIAMGANVKQVQQMLGHSSATVTLDTYSHIFPALSEQLRDGLDATYRQAQAERNVDQTWTNGASEVVKLPPKTAENRP